MLSRYFSRSYSSSSFARKVLNPTCGSWWLLQVQQVDGSSPAYFR